MLWPPQLQYGSPSIAKRAIAQIEAQMIVGVDGQLEPFESTREGHLALATSTDANLGRVSLPDIEPTEELAASEESPLHSGK